MKLARGLSLFLAVALIGTFGTACGKKAVTAPTSDAHLETTSPSQENSNKTTTQQPDGSQKSTDANGKTDGKTGTKTAATSPDSNGNSSSSGGNGEGGATTPAASSGQNGGTSGGGSSSSASSGQAGTFELAVTQNFGSSGMYDQSVGYTSAQSLIDVMRDHLTIETAYGGGFVNSINGVKSGYTDKSIFTRKKRDWFFYVNGSVGAVGADAIVPHAGDDVWWDYHDWSGSGSNTPCVIGAYPHPFTGGYNGAQAGTIIYYGGSHSAEAKRLSASLLAQGANNVTVTDYKDSGIANPGANMIVVGTWSELGSQPAVAQLFGNPTSTGIYASFENGAVSMLDYRGKSTGRTGQALIASTGTGSGDTTPVWLVIGVDDSALDQAVDLLVNHPGELHNKIGAVVSGGSAVEVPVAQ